MTQRLAAFAGLAALVAAATGAPAAWAADATACAGPAGRCALLALGRAQLARGDASAALASFDQAAAREHAADIELGIVRALLQDGAFQRALAMAAHVSGAHPEAVDAGLLYGWLLLVSGQRDFARRVLDEAPPARRADPRWAALQQALSAAPLAAPSGGDADVSTWGPTPLAAEPGPPALRTVASGVLLSGGSVVVVPVAAGAACRTSPRCRVRDARGRSRGVKLDETAAAPEGLAVLRLDAVLPTGDANVDDAAPPREAYPGSPAYVIGYAADPQGRSAWPWLRAGFLGAVDRERGTRTLGIAMEPTLTTGGPVFDASGRWIGMATGDDPARAGWLPRAALADLDRAPASTAAASAPAAVAARPRLASDAVYERGLGRVVQVLVAVD